jgi:CheY-like chemotaxis protein
MTLAMDSEEDLPVTSATPESLLIGRSDVDAVQCAIEQLPVIFREVILLCDVEDASYRLARKMVRESLRSTPGAPPSLRLQGERGKLMAGITLAATLNTPMSELRPATIDRILVIEHDRALRKILQRLFSSEGYEVDVAPNGVAGLEMLRQRPPSVVVLDLPYAESPSSDLCRKIAHLTPDLPLVIRSASSDVAHKVLLLEMGAADYVSIPFSPRELVDRLRALTRRASRG